MFNLIVSCSNRKSVTPHPTIQIRNLNKNDLKKSSDLWHKSLNSSTNRIPAEKLYVGEYWSVVRNISKLGLVRIWIFSAGLGIIPYSEKIPSYGATFSNYSPDSIRNLESNNKATNANWFKLILQKKQFGIGFDDLTTMLGNSPVLFAVSRSYIETIQDILVNRSNPQVFILGSKLGNLRIKNIIETPGKLRMTLGGSLQTVNIRLVEYLLTQTELLTKSSTSVEELSSAVERLANGSTQLPKYERLKSTDLEIEKFIRSRFSKSEEDSHSRALRDFRIAGNACEQSRFKKIFISVMEKN